MTINAKTIISENKAGIKAILLFNLLFSLANLLFLPILYLTKLHLILEYKKKMLMTTIGIILVFTAQYLE